MRKSNWLALRLAGLWFLSCLVEALSRALSARWVAFRDLNLKSNHLKTDCGVINIVNLSAETVYTY